METKHWSDEQLIAALYGAIDREGHAVSCAVCAARWTQLQARRDLLRATKEPDAGFFALQRARIQSRLERPRGRWIPAAALTAACLSVLIFRTFLSPEVPAARPAAVSDAQFFREVSAVVEMEEPRAAAPIRALFEDSE